MASWQRKLGRTTDRETKYDLGHDAAHQLVSATLKQTSNSAVVKDERWGYDSIGNRTSEHDLSTGVTIDYSHNNTNQLLTKKTYSSGQRPWVKGSLDEARHVNLGSGPVAVKGDGSFEGQAPARTTTITAKDATGNVTSENWQMNSGSGATPDATFTYTHDTEGNLLGDGTSSFEWDLRNRLTAIVTGTHRSEFTYDGSDRRVRVVEKESGTVTSDLRYIFQGLSLLEERASNNTTVLRRFYSGGHVDVANGGIRYAYTTDHLGSIREVMQIDGTTGNPTTATLAARYDYDLWGKRSVLDGGTAAETLVMHGYTGHIRHAWSGMWLAPYRAYNTGLGRWISRDPIAEDGGINLYAYVGNHTLVAIDPLGREGINLYPPKDPNEMNDYGDAMVAVPGQFTIAGHGYPSYMVGTDGKAYTAEAMAAATAKHKDYKPGKPVSLAGCNLGATTNEGARVKPYAEDFAAALDKINRANGYTGPPSSVSAPNNIVRPNGFVPIKVAGEGKDDGPANGRNGWNTYTPGKPPTFSPNPPNHPNMPNNPNAPRPKAPK